MVEEVLILEFVPDAKPVVGGLVSWAAVGPRCLQPGLPYTQPI